MAKTLAAIPAYNEQVGIGSVVLQARKYVDEILVVDDGSDDRTAEVAQQANATVYRHTVNEGKGAAVQTALEYARGKEFDAVVLLDGDGQHDPANIPDLLGPVLNNDADVVIGYRNRHNSDMPLYRRFGMRVLDFMTAFGGLDPLRDSQSGFRALSRAAVSSLNLEEKSFGVESEMLIEAKEKGLRIAQVPIAVRYDVDGSTKGPISHGIGVVDRILRIVAVRHPLLFFAVPGVVLFVAGLWFGVDTLNSWNVDRVFYVAKALLTVVFILLGTLSIFAAVILNVMPKAIAHYEAARRRKPPYSEAEGKE